MLPFNTTNLNAFDKQLHLLPVTQLQKMNVIVFNLDNHIGDLEDSVSKLQRALIGFMQKKKRELPPALDVLFTILIIVFNEFMKHLSIKNPPYCKTRAA